MEQILKELKVILTIPENGQLEKDGARETSPIGLSWLSERYFSGGLGKMMGRLSRFRFKFAV